MSDIQYWESEWDAAASTDELFEYPDPQTGGGGGDVSKRPAWKDVYEGYPKNAAGDDDLPADQVFTSILGPDYDSGTFTNACATRVSLGLLNGGMNVKKEFLISVGKFKGKGFIASAINLKNWLSLSSVWGTADEIMTNASSLSSVAAKINGRNGVYTIIGGFGAGVTGHATLWIGANDNVVGGHNYIGGAGDVYFWELQ